MTWNKLARCDNCKDMDCDKCRYLKQQIYYGYAELRWCFWNYLHRWGKAKTKLFYDEIVKVEGKEWVDEALGDKLVAEICS